MLNYLKEEIGVNIPDKELIEISKRNARGFRNDLFYLAKEYQRDILKCTRNFAIFNQTRGTGKTFEILLTILFNKPKNVIIKTQSKQAFKNLQDKFKEIQKLLNYHYFDVAYESRNDYVEDKYNFYLDYTNYSLRDYLEYNYGKEYNEWLTKTIGTPCWIDYYPQSGIFATKIYMYRNDLPDIEYDYIFMDDHLPYAIPYKAKHIFSFVDIDNTDFDKLYPQCIVDKIK
jgi:hypothetical protein